MSLDLYDLPKYSYKILCLISTFSNFLVNVLNLEEHAVVVFGLSLYLNCIGHYSFIISTQELHLNMHENISFESNVSKYFATNRASIRNLIFETDFFIPVWKVPCIIFWWIVVICIDRPIILMGYLRSIKHSNHVWKIYKKDKGCWVPLRTLKITLIHNM